MGNASIWNDIALIHKAQLLGSGVLSQCSIEFIRLFYHKISAKSKNILCWETEQEKAIAFIYCTTDKEGYFKEFIFENLLNLFIYIPDVFKIIIRYISRRQESFITKYSNELVYIAVSNEYKGRGIAKILINKAELEFQKRNIAEYYLQVLANNRRALKLYSELEFEFVEESGVGQKKKILLKKSLCKQLKTIK